MFLETNSDRDNSLEKSPILERAKNALMAKHLPTLAVVSKEFALLTPKQPHLSDDQSNPELIEAYFLVAHALAESPEYLPLAIASFRNLGRHAPSPEQRHQAAEITVKHANNLRKPEDRIAAFVDAACSARMGSFGEDKAVDGFIQSAEELAIPDRFAAYKYAARRAPVDSKLERRSIAGFVILANRTLDAVKLVSAVSNLMMGPKKEEPEIPDFAVAQKSPQYDNSKLGSLEL